MLKGNLTSRNRWVFWPSYAIIDSIEVSSVAFQKSIEYYRDVSRIRVGVWLNYLSVPKFYTDEWQFFRKASVWVHLQFWDYSGQQLENTMFADTRRAVFEDARTREKLNKKKPSGKILRRFGFGWMRLTLVATRDRRPYYAHGFPHSYILRNYNVQLFFTCIN